MFKHPVLISCVFFLVACGTIPGLDKVIPDRREEYRKSQSLPDLEVPPDLTTDALNDPLIIPDEKESNTLSEYQRQRTLRTGGGAPGAAAGILQGDHWLSVPGSNADIWPGLREFWQKKGYTLDLDDPELGVMETQWKESDQEGITVFRNKFRIFTEPGENPGITVLFISNEMEEGIAGDNDKIEWVSLQKNEDMEKQIIGELNVHFYGSVLPASTTTGSSRTSVISSSVSVTRERAEVLNLDDDKVYLSLPEEFTRAWRITEDALLKAGLFIENQDRSKGLYYVLYYQAVENDEGMLSKLAFWKSDQPEGKEYQISLTGVGDKTELVVLNEKGDWADHTEASQILTLLQTQYNSR